MRKSWSVFHEPELRLRQHGVQERKDFFLENNGFKNYKKKTEQADRAIVTNARSAFFENRTNLVNLPLCKDSLRGQNKGEKLSD